MASFFHIFFFYFIKYIGDIMRKKRIYLLIVPVMVLVFMLCGCSETVNSYSEELILNSWNATLNNGDKMTLSFSGDDATLKLVLKDDEKVVISGFCELDENYFVIHDEVTKIPYAFSYIVHFDRVEIVYGENTVSLYKS